MKKDHEIMSDEELKKFFLNEAMLLCSATRFEESEIEKLHILFGSLRKINKLLGTLCYSNMEVHYMEVLNVFGFYFTEKEGERKVKHRMNTHLSAYSQFIFQLTKFKELTTHYYYYTNSHLKALAHVMQICYPNDFKEGEINEIEIKQFLAHEKEE